MSIKILLILMKVPLFQVDSFTLQPFSGNPAAVCLLDTMPEDKWMQRVASETNLSETAFLVKDEKKIYIRWFTPKTEVELCGHATLASAHILWEEGFLEMSEPIRFSSLKGELVAHKIGGWIELDFPSEPLEPCQKSEILEEILNVEFLYTGKSRMDYLAMLESERKVQNLKPDLDKLASLKMRGLIVTAVSHSVKFDFVSRFFAPAIGIDEDPVTGSTHCCLGPFWAERLNKTHLTAYQHSHRGGTLKIRVKNNRVFISGQAITVFRGELII